MTQSKIYKKNQFLPQFCSLPQINSPMAITAFWVHAVKLTHWNVKVEGKGPQKMDLVVHVVGFLSLQGCNDYRL